MNKINIVTSYSNPDTDGIACSIAMTQLLSREDEKWFTVVLGSLGPETTFVLKHLGIPFPNLTISLDEADKIVLVDTHHKAQLPADFPFNKVVTIIDHHLNGDDHLFPFATILNEKVGAAASLVAKRYIDNNINNIRILSLLGYAILSNTLNFSAPSTTDFDKEVFNQISAIAPIDMESIDEMFRQRSLILKRDIYAALCADFKVFDTKFGKVGISQIEAYNLESQIDVSQFLSALKRIANERKLNLCMFNGVDIKSKQSLVLAANKESQELLCSIFQLDKYSEPQIFDRILLRKTDFIPQLSK